MSQKTNPSINSKKILLVYKHSRFAYAIEQVAHQQHNTILDEFNPITKSLLIAHQKNLACIDHVSLVLKKLGLTYDIMCRSKVTPADTDNRFIISIGGDGTLLDVSHFCMDSPILGVNSDPASSVGALCAASLENFESVIHAIYQHQFTPSPLQRLAFSIDDKPQNILPLNDLLFCHKNPAAMSRFSLTLQGKTEQLRSSGVWVSTPAGSTGGIFSSGATPLPMDAKNAIFRVREPSFSAVEKPQLLHGIIEQRDRLLIGCHMSDAAIFIDGPHKSFDIELGQTVEIGPSDKLLWLFDGERLENNRKKIIESRLAVKNLL